MEKIQIEKIRSLLKKAVSQTKCGRCGCLREGLEYLQSSLQSLHSKEASDLFKDVESWLRHMESIKYHCLGCEYCLSAAVMNLFDEAFSEQNNVHSVSCTSGFDEFMEITKKILYFYHSLISDK